MKISKEDRAQLCTQCDFEAILAEDNIELKKSGSSFLCSLRNERTPSCHVWEPNTGKHGHKGWTYFDFGIGEGGDALKYLIEQRELPASDAIQILIESSGYIPEGWKSRNHIITKRKKTIKKIERYTIPSDVQKAAVKGFIRVIDKIDPSAKDGGLAYLKSRGLIDASAYTSVRKLEDRKTCSKIARYLFKEDAELYVNAGILKNEERPLLQWFNPTIIMTCRTRKNNEDFYCVGRQLDDQPKYMNQNVQMGAVRIPFGLPMLSLCAKERGRLLVHEGPTDALGSKCLGHYAIGMLSRLSEHSFLPYIDILIEDLRLCESVFFVPDNDPEPEKLKESLEKCEKAVSFLRSHQIKSQILEMHMLALGEFKDTGIAAEVLMKAKSDAH